MKEITTENGLTFTGFEFKDLTGKVRENVLNEHYQFLAETNEVENEDGEMVIEDLDYDEDYIIENIEINEYIFHLDGSLLPITTYTGKHPDTGKHSIKIMDNEIFCSIS